AWLWSGCGSCTDIHAARRRAYGCCSPRLLPSKSQYSYIIAQPSSIGLRLQYKYRSTRRDEEEFAMWKQAIEQAVEQTRKNIERFGDDFPHVSKDKVHYVLSGNTVWTDGFWSGILWLCYEYTGDKVFRDAAVRTVKSMG